MTTPGFTAETSLSTKAQYQSCRSHPGADKTVIEPAQEWGKYEKRCVDTDVMRYSAILWGIPWGESWTYWCRNTPGYGGRKPDRCVNTRFNIWGEWYVAEPCLHFSTSGW